MAVSIASHQRLYPTRVRVILAAGGENAETYELPHDPGLEELRKIIAPHLNKANFEHVVVFAAFGPGEKETVLDMFIDERGLDKRLKRNEIATAMYRNACMKGMTRVPKPDDPEKLHFVVGNAVVFDRIIWK
jgi:hypothetical protein